MESEACSAASDGETSILPAWRETMEGTWWRLVVTWNLPPRWFQAALPTAPAARVTGDPPSVELVSHCWNYAPHLTYQLSSLVRHPPRRMRLCVTVCYCPEDQATAELLHFFEQITVPNVTWNWRPLPRELVLRRSIGRNQAARATTADWIWFTDCDLLFEAGCLDDLADLLPERTEPLLHPREEATTALLPEDHSVFEVARGQPAVRGVDGLAFEPHEVKCATGPLQIVRGDVARAGGYCGGIRLYQRPASRWRKTYEDRALRWLLGTPGTPIDLPGVRRLRHVSKGRYPDRGLWKWWRQTVRRTKERWLKPRATES